MATTATTTAQLINVTDRLLILYNACAQWAIRESARTKKTHLLFNITIKCHYLVHLSEQARFIHPAKGWCYQDEDFVGRMKIIAASCMRGSRLAQALHKIMYKYMVAMHIRFSEFDNQHFLQEDE